ncbi:MAG: hypothetical protein K2L82_01915 [Lachnospiraceae bacterium]|nr:hypothetical protein [Lachnospiraceae bacterium]
MRLYKLELSKISSRKFTWVISGMWFAMIVFVSCQEVGMAERVLVEFGQAAGYRRFPFLIQLLICFTIVWLSVVLSPMFCEDRQIKTDVLILTSVNGRFADYVARLGVVFTLVISSFVFVLLLTYGICYALYGYVGNGFTAEDIFLLEKYAPALAKADVETYNTYYLLRVISALMMLAGIIVWISARCSKTVNALVATLIVVLCPLMTEGFFMAGSIGDFICSGQPMILIVETRFWFNYEMYGGHILLAYLVVVIGIICGGRNWCQDRRKKQ